MDLTIAGKSIRACPYKKVSRLLSKRNVFTALVAVVAFIGICTVGRQEIDSIRKSKIYQRQNISEYADLAKFVEYAEKPAVRKSYHGVAKFLQLENQLKERLREATEKKIILTWVPMFGKEAVVEIDRENCGNCVVAYDHAKVTDHRTGAVVFHFDGIIEENMPKIRNPNQLYIFWAMESPATLNGYRSLDFQFENAFQFNDTMTYRRDSGFYQNYDHDDALMTIVKSPNFSPEYLLKQKRKVAVTVVSNCGLTRGGKIRMKKLHEIRSLGFPLDAFGDCFPGRHEFAKGKDSSMEGFLDVVRKYKFYFSFENSFHCKDYITEKFFHNGLASLAVPVVWGARKEDYLAVAPPGSFIFADDFSSMKELAFYLKYLDSNDTAYKQHLKWVTMKPEEMPQYGRATFYCQICRALHGINIDDIYNPKFNESNLLRPLFSKGVAPRKVSNLIDWFYGEDNDECFNH